MFIDDKVLYDKATLNISRVFPLLHCFVCVMRVCPCACVQPFVTVSMFVLRRAMVRWVWWTACGSLPKKTSWMGTRSRYVAPEWMSSFRLCVAVVSASKHLLFSQTCYRCKARRRCTKKFTIQKFPKILVLRILSFRHLKSILINYYTSLWNVSQMYRVVLPWLCDLSRPEAFLWSTANQQTVNLC